jgi:sec-independent protein translocase protein TatA
MVFTHRAARSTLSTMGFISAPGPLEMMVILVVALLVLGPQRLPDVARSVGKGMRELKDSLQGVGDDDDDPYADELEEERPTAKPVP